MFKNRTSLLSGGGRLLYRNLSRHSAYFSAGRDQEEIDFGFKSVPRGSKASLVAQVFSNVASSYDVMNDLMSGGMHRHWKDSLVEKLRPFPGMQHLDVAGGTGDVAMRVLRAIRAAELQSPQSQASPASASTKTQAAGGVSSSTYAQSSSSHTQPSASSHSTHTGNARESETHRTGKESSTPSSSPSPAAQIPLPSESTSQTNQQSTRGAVTVFDINAEMLEQGQKRVQGTDLAGDEGLSWILGNAEQLPFPDESFDSYTIAFGIRNVTDRDAALREARRVLKRGGRFLCLEFSTVHTPGLKELYDVYSINVIPKVGGLVANDEESYRYLVESIRMFPDQDTFADMIEDAGFKKVGYESIMGGIVAVHSGFKL